MEERKKAYTILTDLKLSQRSRPSCHDRLSTLTLTLSLALSLSYASTAVRREVYEVAEWLQPFNTGPKRKTYARPSEGAEGANALGLKGAKPVQRDIFGFRKTGPRAIARGRGGD